MPPSSLPVQRGPSHHRHLPSGDPSAWRQSPHTRHSHHPHMAGLQGLPASAFVPGMFAAPPVFAANALPASGVHVRDFSHLNLGAPVHRTAHHQIYPVLDDTGRARHLMSVDNRRGFHRAGSSQGDPAVLPPHVSTVQHGVYKGRFASFWGCYDGVHTIYHAIKSLTLVAAGIAASVMGGN